MSDITWTNGTRKLSALIPWPRNPRQIKGESVRRLQESFEEFGQPEVIAISPSNEVYNGHQRLKSWFAKFGDIEVDVRVSDRALTEKERERLTVLLHRGAVGEWDFETLANEFDVGELLEWGFTEMELGLDGAAAGNADAEPQVDRAAELNEKWQVQPGDLWRVGEHRLICGDCTDEAVVKRVMGGERAEMVWTDPPYGVAVGDKNKYLNSIAPSNRVEENLTNDTLDEVGLMVMLCAAFDNAITHCTAGAAWYVAAPAGPLHVLFGQALKERGIWRQTLQWVKNNATFSPMGVCYHWQAEPIFFGWLPNGGHRWHGGRTQTTVWNIDRPAASPEHPTMKPVELVVRAIENSSLLNEIVFDPFLGSGTTMVACQNLGRRCRAVEIAPGYVAVALERMSVAFAGIVIERVE